MRKERGRLGNVDHVRGRTSDVRSCSQTRGEAPKEKRAKRVNRVPVELNDEVVPIQRFRKLGVWRHDVTPLLTMD